MVKLFSTQPDHEHEVEFYKIQSYPQNSEQLYARCRHCQCAMVIWSNVNNPMDFSTNDIYAYDSGTNKWDIVNC